MTGWSQQQINAAKDTFDKEEGFLGLGIAPSYTADIVQRGIATVVYNPSQVTAKRFGGLRAVVTHSFIHPGGQPGVGGGAHDLAEFGGYKEIVDACK